MSARRRLKNGYFRALALARAHDYVRRVRASRGQVLALNLHGVTPRVNPYWPPLTPEAFEHLVTSLVAGCRLTTFGELREPSADSRLRVVLSFDDGNRDFVDYVIPILARHSVRANQNVIVDCVETGRPPWVVAVVDALAAADVRRVRSLRVPGFVHDLFDDDESKVRYGTALTNYLKARPPADRARLMDDINGLLDETDPGDLTRMMSRGDVEAAAEVHEIGGHSVTHESMEFLSNTEFEAELDRQDEWFSNAGHPMKVFAFPNGSFRSDQIRRVVERGAEHVLLVDERPTSGDSVVHARIPIYGDSRAELQVRALGCTPGMLRRLGRG